MPVVGAFARVKNEGLETTVRGLESIEGVSTFEIEAPGKVGLLIEAESLDNAHQVLTDNVRSVEGVLGVWPVYANIEDEQLTNESQAS